ncbi:hypothetical protein RJ641_022943 [Dillenia turbinata]|uniref:Uncharacterized protein n=1 Tax=Dillenia turbinata TaxID=194707 RepID=A0AAN8UMZ5_9MAGN
MSILLQMGVQKNCIISSCAKTLTQRENSPVVLLHSFDRNLIVLVPHPYAFVYGTALEIFGSKAVLISPSVYAEGIGNLARLPKTGAYAGVSLLKSIPLQLYANLMTFNNVSFSTNLDWTDVRIFGVGCLHCLLPWWENAAVDFMISGGYNVLSQIRQVKNTEHLLLGAMMIRLLATRFHQYLFHIDGHGIVLCFVVPFPHVSLNMLQRLQSERQNATLCWIPECGHLPHVEKFDFVAKLIADFTGSWF